MEQCVCEKRKKIEGVISKIMQAKIRQSFRVGRSQYWPEGFSVAAVLNALRDRAHESRRVGGDEMKRGGHASTRKGAISSNQGKEKENGDA